MAEPVLRFDSQFHRVIDATVWLYGTKGRPVAVQEVECYRRPRRSRVLLLPGLAL